VTDSNGEVKIKMAMANVTFVTPLLLCYIDKYFLAIRDIESQITNDQMIHMANTIASIGQKLGDSKLNPSTE